MLFEQAGDYILNKLQKELPVNIYYHNADHTRDVYAAAKRIGEGEHISEYEMKLLLTAAWYHDCGFLEVAEGHELVSCRIARETLPNFGYTLDEIEKICGIIMATRLPQSPKGHLQEILADADLDYLGRDDFFTIGDKMFRELSLPGRDEWNDRQLNFLRAHQYFTQTALNLRGSKKQENLQQVEALLQ